MLYPARPAYFPQTPKEAVLIWEEDHMVRHILPNRQASAER
jgi:hypothetical protein